MADNYLDDLKEERKEVEELQRYASRFTLLTKEEEFKLTTQYYLLRTQVIPRALTLNLDTRLTSKLTRRVEDIKEELTNKNLRLVLKSAQSPSYVNRGLSMFDLFMEGLDGLRYGIDKYDPSKLNSTGKANKLSTYVTYWIKQRIGRSIEKKGSLVKIPGHIQALMSKIRRVVGKFTTDPENKGERPSPETILLLLHKEYPNHKSLIGLTEDKIAELGRLAWQHVSLDEVNNADEGALTMVDYLAADESYQPEIMYDETAKREMVFKLLECLDEQEKMAITFRWGLLDYQSRSAKQVAKLMKVPFSDYKKIEASAMDKLKQNATLDMLL